MIEYINIELKHSVLLYFFKKNQFLLEKGDREGENMFLFHQNKEVIFDDYFRASSTQDNESLFQDLGRFEN